MDYCWAAWWCTVTLLTIGLAYELRKERRR